MCIGWKQVKGARVKMYIYMEGLTGVTIKQG